MNPGDIIQINDLAHPRYPALLIVDKVRDGYVRAYALVPQCGDVPASCGRLYTKLPNDAFVRVGTAPVPVPVA
jgi:hypothetical protein